MTTLKGLYPLVDQYPGTFNKEQHFGRDLRAQATGEFRPPKAKEWYLSGAIIEAYRAKADMTTAYHIARIVRVARTTHVTETIIETL